MKHHTGHIALQESTNRLRSADERRLVVLGTQRTVLGGRHADRSWRELAKSCGWGGGGHGSCIKSSRLSGKDSIPCWGLSQPQTYENGPWRGLCPAYVRRDYYSNARKPGGGMDTPILPSRNVDCSGLCCTLVCLYCQAPGTGGLCCNSQ